MATGGDRLNDPDYINWLRATLALMYMKEGLEEFSNNQSDFFHKQLLKKFVKATPACKGHCSSTDIKKDFRKRIWSMSCSVCDTWLQNAISYHISAPFPNMSPENTHPELWQTEPWETIKLFIPYGCEKDKSARDADIQGILSLFIKCKHFSTGAYIERQDLLEKLLRIRNSLLHSATFKVSETDVKNYFQTVLSFMQGMKGLTGNEKDTLQTAIEKVQQLEANQIEISVNKELEIQALKERQVALDKDLRALVDLTQQEQDKQSTEVKQNAETLNELMASKVKFHEFLEQNDLVCDVAKISKRITDMDQTIYQHDARIRTIEYKMQSITDAQIGSANELEDQSSVLLQHLLNMYGKRKFWENPVSFEEAFLSQMYVQPSVKLNREIDDKGVLAEVKQQEYESHKLTYEMLFMCETGPCENIYLTGGAGKGKTTFCNQLLLQWCNAVQNIQSETVSSGELNVLASFRFLFHINLRDTETIYHVEDMIQEQLLSNVPVALNLSDILKTERCLIILDGLDEWSCPENVKKCPGINKHIPGRNTAHTNCVFLTTTRTWKYDVIALKNKDVDKYIELSGIDAKSSEELAEKILENLDKKSEIRKDVTDFYDEVEQKELNEFLTVPVLLIQLLTLWHAGIDFGNSQLQLYCSMLELLFERSEKNLPEEISKCSSTNVATQAILPECFNTKENCQKYAELIHCLAKLAYKSLFNNQKEEALVFKSSRLGFFGISPSDIQLCLHCGILCQCKDYGNYTGRYKKFSFLHKKVQECLAALYFVDNDNVEDILNDVKLFCNSVDTMLEMRQVWLFVAGIDPDMTKRLLDHLDYVVSRDERVKTYRQTLGGDWFSGSGRLIDRIQSCVSDCISEGINNGHHFTNICLKDIRIYSSNVRFVEHLLLCSDTSKVKSVCIRTRGSNAARVAAITDQLKQCRSLQKLDLSDPSPLLPDSRVTIVNNNCESLTSLYLANITATDKLVTAICSSISKYLMALEMSEANLTHEHTEQLFHSLFKSPAIRQLYLRGLNRTYNVRECRSMIDWSAMTQLQELTLSFMYVDNLQSLPNCVEKMVLDYVTLPMASLRDFARGLSKTRRKVTVELNMVTFTETRELGGIIGFFRRKATLVLRRRELKAFLLGCPGVELTECEYEDRSNRWDINFKCEYNDNTDSDSE